MLVELLKERLQLKAKGVRESKRVGTGRGRLVAESRVGDAVVVVSAPWQGREQRASANLR
jgi:hypothetical protein